MMSIDEKALEAGAMLAPGSTMSECLAIAKPIIEAYEAAKQPAPAIGGVGAVSAFDKLMGYGAPVTEREGAATVFRFKDGAWFCLSKTDENRIRAALASSTPAETTDHSGIPGGWGKHMLAEATAPDAGIHSPFNACCHRDECRKLLDRALAAEAALAAAREEYQALRAVYDAGLEIWSQHAAIRAQGE